MLFLSSNCNPKLNLVPVFSCFVMKYFFKKQLHFLLAPTKITLSIHIFFFVGIFHIASYRCHISLSFSYFLPFCSVSTLLFKLPLSSEMRASFPVCFEMVQFLTVCMKEFCIISLCAVFKIIFVFVPDTKSCNLNRMLKW